MLKLKKSNKKLSFKNKHIKNYKFNSNKVCFFVKNKSIFNLNLLITKLKVILRLVKKRNIRVYINFKNNLIRFYKSKNARMGKGKGKITKYLILHNKRNSGYIIKNSKSIKKNFFKYFKKC